jgi:hypothetical protein
VSHALNNGIADVARYVLIPLFCAVTGYTEKAVRRKIQSGVWLQGQLWRKAPDGHILIDMEGFHRWVEQQTLPGSKSGADQSA